MFIVSNTIPLYKYVYRSSPCGQEHDEENEEYLRRFPPLLAEDKSPGGEVSVRTLRDVLPIRGETVPFANPTPVSNLPRRELLSYSRRTDSANNQS